MTTGFLLLYQETPAGQRTFPKGLQNFDLAFHSGGLVHLRLHNHQYFAPRRMSTPVFQSHRGVLFIIIIIIIIIVIMIIIVVVVFVIIIIIIIIIITVIELTHSKIMLENTVEIEPQPAALDFKNLSQYSSRSK